MTVSIISISIVTLSIMTLSITSTSIMTLRIMTLSLYDIQHNGTSIEGNIAITSKLYLTAMLSVIILSVVAPF
jgi:hypothetical protein